MATKILKGMMFATLSITTLGTTAGAVAQSASQVVKYDDLDLSTAKGQEKLHSRLKSAVQKACIIPIETGTRLKMYDNECIEAEMAKVEQRAKTAIAQYKAQRGLANNNDAIVSN